MDTSLHISDLYIYRRGLREYKGILVIHDGQVDYFGFKITLKLGKIDSLRYRVSMKGIAFKDAANKKYVFRDDGYTWLYFSPAEASKLIRLAPTPPNEAASASARQLIIHTLGPEAGWNIDDGKIDYHMLEVILNASGAKKM